MISINILAFTLFVWSTNVQNTVTQSCPGKWTATEHHCYQQVVGAVATETEAKTKCAALARGSIPVTVHSHDDNTELVQFINTGADTTFYIGLEYKPGSPAGEWDWLDSGNAKTFHLWDDTADDSGALPCVYMTVVNKVTSHWLTNDCKKPMKSLVCQMPAQSLSTLYDTVGNLTDMLKKLEQKVDNDIIPIGFIYVQLPDQATPAQIWSSTSKWSDVTSTYAGLFFRAEGGSSGAFSPSGVNVQSASLFNEFSFAIDSWDWVDHRSDHTTKNTEVHQYSTSDQIVPGETIRSMQITMDVTDARPRNTAVRIWRRTG